MNRRDQSGDSSISTLREKPNGTNLSHQLSAWRRWDDDLSASHSLRPTDEDDEVRFRPGCHRQALTLKTAFAITDDNKNEMISVVAECLTVSFPRDAGESQFCEFCLVLIEMYLVSVFISSSFAAFLVNYFFFLSRHCSHHYNFLASSSDSFRFSQTLSFFFPQWCRLLSYSIITSFSTLAVGLV